MTAGATLMRQRFVSPVVGVVLFSIFSIGANLLWLARDSLQPYGDPAVHLEASYRMHQALRHGDLFGFTTAWISAFRGGLDPPLVALLPLPLAAILGFSTIVALLSLTALVAVFNFFLYRLVTRCANPRVAVMAVAVTGTLPVAYGMSRMYFAEYATMTAVTAYLYFLIRSEDFTRTRANFWLGVTAGLGLLTKVTFPLFVFIPTLIFFLRRLGSRPKRLVADLAMVATPAVAVASLWYASNIVPAWSWAFGRSVGSVSGIYSQGSVFSLRTVTRFWQTVVEVGLTPWYTLVFGLLVALGVWRMIRNRPVGRISADAYALALGWFLFPLIVITLGVNKDVRFLTPALPGFAMLFSLLWHDALASAALRLVPLAVAGPLAAYLVTSFDLLPPGRWSGVLGSVVGNRTWYAAPPRTARFPLEEIVALLTVQPPHSPFSTPRLVLDLVQGEPLNWAGLQYAATLQGVNQAVTFFGRSWIDPEEELALYRAVDYVLAVSPTYPGYGNLRAMRQQFLAGVASRRLPFLPVARFSLPDDANVIVYRRDGF